MFTLWLILGIFGYLVVGMGVLKVVLWMDDDCTDGMARFYYAIWPVVLGALLTCAAALIIGVTFHGLWAVPIWIKSGKWPEDWFAA